MANQENIDIKEKRYSTSNPEILEQNCPSTSKTDNFDIENEINGNRYAEIVTQSNKPLFAFLRFSIREDLRFMLPRIIMRTAKTMRRIPRTFIIKTEKELEHYVFETITLWARSITKITKMDLEVRGAEKIIPDRTYLFASNHRSPADIPILFVCIPQPAAFVANDLFRKIPALSYWMRASGSVFVDQGNPQSEVRALKAMEKRLKKGRSLILFPEGHMHQGKGIGEFSRGGLFAAVLCGVPIVPICTYGTEKVMRPGSFHINPYRHVVVEFGDPIETKNLGRADKKRIHLVVYDIIKNMRTALEQEFSPSKKKI
ncbi:MAG: lysophospholipid acyltransferase family protein [Rectinema sp.]